MREMHVFSGGGVGSWRVLDIETLRGDVVLPPVARLDVAPHDAAGAAWTLRGFVSNLRYATRPEVTTLRAVQAEMGRPQATRAALIPIRKNAAWWALAQDERRAIFEDASHHTAIGLAYLPGIARRLHHGRDLGEPFDFLTWFDYAPEDSDAFEALVVKLRTTREWDYVDREIDIRLAREA